MTGAFLCAALSIVPTVRHADYLGSWLEVLREDNRAIIRAASAASKAADYLLAFSTGDPAPEAAEQALAALTPIGRRARRAGREHWCGTGPMRGLRSRLYWGCPPRTFG
jgi:zincin-like metallopeptidase